MKMRRNKLMEFGYSVEACDVYSHRVANQKSRRRRRQPWKLDWPFKFKNKTQNERTRLMPSDESLTSLHSPPICIDANESAQTVSII